ncbi:heme biosynthesis protein HemY [Salipaludibacillus neizhouensis]|uniref:Heme biosynthesis protein HemY n=1 Tax=Salipaludibacillus neizhouensis TaxID=885475 RepID=A0A3A9KLK5_9BACI|nr:iron-sulfur cluster biosynthesis family protein [Salipaludibacillus neizhouensis]RKL68715.1 heme biosynthesis protein HemY [Salipaludibacillus neizhouensis]
MEVFITNEAINVINETASLQEDQVLFIQYETDGCGCVVSGVSQLVELKEQDITDRELLIETTPLPFRVAIEKRVEWIYDEKLIIDFSKNANMLQLKSPNQMINPRMSFMSWSKSTQNV